MRLTAAFFANRADVVDGMLNLDGGFWNSTTLDPSAAGFRCYTVVVCDADNDDVGQRFSLIIDGQGPSGHRWTPAHSTSFTLDSPIKFMCMPLMVLPVEPGGGPHLYTFRLDGQHERVDVPLTVRVGRPVA
jgi:hypothetical protein